MTTKLKLLLAGITFGSISVILVTFGNPKNMGFCIACFIRDTVGALGLHRAEAAQYIRPEIIGLTLGAFAIAVLKKEFLPKGGSSPITRFLLGFIVMINCLVFLGCPVRMILRIAGGDANAIVGFFGFIGGIVVGVAFLKKGYSLKRSYSLPKMEGAWIVGLQVLMFALLITAPTFILFSETGPGSMHAPVLLSLVAGVVVGVVTQRTRLCIMGGVRDLFLFKDTTLIIGFIGVLSATFIGNLITGDFNFGFVGQPVAHVDSLWNFLSMSAVGLASVLLGGCPTRQLILAGEGNSDSAVTILGYAFGAAVAHNFGLVSAVSTLVDGETTGGPTDLGKIAVIASITLILIIASYNTKIHASPKEGKHNV